MKIRITESQLKNIINLISENESDESNVLFIGDSLSDGPGFTWNYVLEKKHPDWNVKHIAKVAKTTDWMLGELKNELSDKNYDKVFIYGGTNDMFNNLSKETAFNNIQQMVNLVKENGGTPYLFIGYDAESVMPKNMKPTSYCDSKCMKKGRENMIEFQKYLKNITGAVIIPKIEGDTTWTSDGTHPSANRHIQMANYVEDYIGRSTDFVKSTKKDKDEGFFDKLKNFVSNPYEFLFGKSDSTLKNDLIDGLEKINENYIVKKKNLFLYEGLEYDTDKKDEYNEDIKLVQVSLQLLKYLKPEYGITGKYDIETKKAIEDFQEKNNIESSGNFDNQTKEKLIQLVKDKNIKDKDFENLEYKKTKEISKEESENEIYSSLKSPGSVSSSNVKSKFKQVLDENDIDYNDFVDDVERIGLDIDVAINQLYAESGFSDDVIKCRRNSSAGAQGIAQFMPTTWPSYGNGSPCNIKDALPAYIKLMKFLIKKFDGRIDLALAGYNSGPYRSVYTDALKNDTPFEDLKGKVPTETWNYVNKILS
jgi:lysophospholipase L1-like esterase/peptidoglycan hydrolase-like protein with peptidoglycan-binding domain